MQFKENGNYKQIICWPRGKFKTKGEKIQKDKRLLNINEKFLGVKNKMSLEIENTETAYR